MDWVYTNNQPQREPLSRSPPPPSSTVLHESSPVPSQLTQIDTRPQDSSSATSIPTAAPVAAPAAQAAPSLPTSFSVTGTQLPSSSLGQLTPWPTGNNYLSYTSNSVPQPGHHQNQNSSLAATIPVAQAEARPSLLSVASQTPLVGHPAHWGEGSQSSTLLFTGDDSFSILPSIEYDPPDPKEEPKEEPQSEESQEQQQQQQQQQQQPGPFPEWLESSSDSFTSILEPMPQSGQPYPARYCSQPLSGGSWELKVHGPNDYTFEPRYPRSGGLHWVPGYLYPRAVSDPTPVPWYYPNRNVPSAQPPPNGLPLVRTPSPLNDPSPRPSSLSPTRPPNGLPAIDMGQISQFYPYEPLPQPADPHHNPGIFPGPGQGHVHSNEPGVSAGSFDGGGGGGGGDDSWVNVVRDLDVPAGPLATVLGMTRRITGALGWRGNQVVKMTWPTGPNGPGRVQWVSQLPFGTVPEDENGPDHQPSRSRSPESPYMPE